MVDERTPRRFSSRATPYPYPETVPGERQDVSLEPVLSPPPQVSIETAKAIPLPLEKVAENLKKLIEALGYKK